MTHVVASRLSNGRRRRLKTFGDGRVCAHDQCDTLLSRYNPNDLCRLHAPLRYPRNRGVVTQPR